MTSKTMPNEECKHCGQTRDYHHYKSARCRAGKTGATQNYSNKYSFRAKAVPRTSLIEAKNKTIRELADVLSATIYALEGTSTVSSLKVAAAAQNVLTVNAIQIEGANK